MLLIIVCSLWDMTPLAQPATGKSATAGHQVGAKMVSFAFPWAQMHVALLTRPCM